MNKEIKISIEYDGECFTYGIPTKDLQASARRLSEKYGLSEAREFSRELELVILRELFPRWKTYPETLFREAAQKLTDRLTKRTNKLCTTFSGSRRARSVRTTLTHVILSGRSLRGWRGRG